MTRIACPACGTPVHRARIGGTSFRRPYVCVECARAWRVHRPAGQWSLLFLFGTVGGTALPVFAPDPARLFAWLALVGVIAALDRWLLARTARLTPVLPRHPGDRAEVGR
ncbi:hypothetical protein [Dokdonella sp.]|uniref:hypothetical protein n=1 Tax=Dokdonella sp. TaxID=2291710 RepID=UPI002624B106|nr:hypothetical protein [Dokdonella sp.]